VNESAFNWIILTYKMKNQDFISKTKGLFKIWNPKLINKDSQTIFEIENRHNGQKLIIQNIKEDCLWVRLRAPKSAYLCESYEEFENYTMQMLNGLIEVAIGYKDAIWKETLIVYTN